MTLMRHIKSTPAVFRLFFLAMGPLLAFSSFSTLSYAQSACDTEIMDAMESRAWLEAQREITQNKNIISKPDSVLEYTCFKDFLDVLAGTADVPMFSDLHDIVNHTGQMRSSLQALVGNALDNYLTKNFNHDYIDSRGIGDFYQGVSGNIAMDNSYNCNEMGRIWDTSQCLDFQNESRDGFFTLDWYVNNDPRIIDGCSPAGGTGAYLSSAYNGNSAAYMVNNGSPNDGTKYAKDNVQSFLSFIQPGSCSQPIPTGLIVHRENYTYERYCDHVCSNPGCYYQPDSALPGPFGGGPPCTSNAPGTTGQCVN